MKSLIKSLSTSLLLVTVILTTAQAEGKTYCGIVTTEKTSLKIYEDISEDTKVIATASKGSALAYRDAQAGWYKVTLDDGKTGYTRNEFIIDPIGDIRCVKVQINKVNDTTLNVREGMGADTKVIGKVGEGAMLRLLDKEGEEGKWVRVQLNNGKMGYVNKGFIQLYFTQINEDTATSVEENVSDNLSGEGNNDSSSSWQCGAKKYCSQMSSCAEAEFYLNTCGLQKLDRDDDGIPCESLCQ